ncbi:MAG: cellulase family glycosylhydrolase [Paludibacteraceae bacterium]|nr:cellulase family glycosylhydrolase [Paludibacteraceae bacterium]
MKKRILSLFVTLLACIMSANATLSTTDYANNDYVGEWGRLKLVGNQLCAENGDTIQLRGVSTFSVQYHEVLPCLTLDGFKALKKWGCSVVRLSQYPVSEVGRYDSISLKRILQLIDYCADLNMYVIADWNVFDVFPMDGNPLKLQKEAITFFTDITSYVKEKGYKHVLYEICGEPTIEWYGILNYSRAILPIIEANDPGAIVIVGTPDKSRDLTDVLDEPIEGYDLGIMYAYHHSACDGGSYLPGVKKAAEELPLIVSEWWVTDYEGSNGGCFDKSDEFIDFLADSTAQKISWIYWAFGQKNEASNMMKQCIFDENDTYVSNSGKYIIPKFGFMQIPTVPVVAPVAPQVDCDVVFPHLVHQLEAYKCDASLSEVLLHTNYVPVNSVTGEVAVLDSARAEGYEMEDPFFVGDNIVKWTFTYPSSGLSTTCEQVITVKDVTPPSFDCDVINNVRIVAEEGDKLVSAAKLNFTLLKPVDPCGEVAVTAIRSDEKNINDPYPIGKTIIEYRFADVHGNVLSCQQDVEVVANYKVVDCDKSYPIARLKTDSCKVDFNSTERAMTPPVDLYFDDVAVVDTFRVSGASFDEPFMVGTDTVVWKFKFPKTGKEETCEQMVVVEDATPLNEFIDCEQFADVKIKLMQGGSALYDTPLNISSCAEHPCTGALICPEISRSDSMPMNAPVPVGKTILHYKFTSKTGEVLVCNQVLEVEIEDPLNTEGVDADNVVAVVPNPTNGQFSVVVAEPSTISIYNAVGVKVYECKSETTLTITNKFEPGIYSVVVEGANSVKTVKLIVSVN